MKFSVIPVPSMSTQGWITDLGAKVDRLMAYFYSNYQDQSILYKDGLMSAERITNLTGNVTDDMIEELQSAGHVKDGRLIDRWDGSAWVRV